MVEVFRTNVEDPFAADMIVAELLAFFPHYRINFDLEDCDKILRVAGAGVHAPAVAQVVRRKGFVCEVLEE